MTNIMSTQSPALSPFRFDTSPQGEADVDPDQIAVIEGKDNQTDGWGKDGFDFKDVLDVINPLQHIPVISTFYRAVTGDEIAPAPRALGGALFGGPVGLVAAVGNNIMEAETGADMGETAIAMFNGTKNSPAAAPQVAAATPERDPTSTPTVIQELGTINASKIPGKFIPSETAMRAGLFSGKNLPIPGSTAGASTGQAVSPRPSDGLQAAPASALDRLIAKSKAAANTNQSGQQPLIPTDSGNVHDWMLRALGKYETMPKG